MKRFFLCCALALPVFGQKWTIQYFFDDIKQDMEFVDIAFPSPDKGIAVGTIYERATGHERNVAVVTSDAGADWKIENLKDFPRSIFFLNDSTGWMVGDHALWFTDDFGKNWKKLSDQLKPDKDLEPPTTIELLLRVWFLDDKHGFGVGLQKTIVETKDGGRTWNPVEAAAQPAGNPAYTAYTHISFGDGKHGVIVGGSEEPRRQRGSHNIPAWMDPERAAKQKPPEDLTLLLQTGDAGATWKSASVEVSGLVSSMRFTGPDAVMVMGFDDSNQWPSDVFRFVGTAEGTETKSIFRDKSPRIIDAQVYPGPHIYLAGVEPTGKMNTAAIPGKIEVLESEDFSTWRQMPVDYKATARSVVITGPDKDHLWIATDTGMILHLRAKP